MDESLDRPSDPTRAPEGAALSYGSIDNKRFYYVADHPGSVVGMSTAAEATSAAIATAPTAKNAPPDPNAHIVGTSRAG